MLAKGYIGPGALGRDSASGIRFLCDPRIVAGTRWVTGADTPGRHVIGLVAGRDFTPDGVIDVAEVLAGDLSPDGEELEIARGIEIGHIFQLGRLYADALGLTVQGPDGKPVTVTMGSYGIGVSRAVAAIAEATCDAIGLCWPARDRAGRRARRDRRQAGRRAVAGRRGPCRRDGGRRPPRAPRRPRLGLTRREVQGRRAARRPDDRGGRAAAWPTASSRSRTAGPATARTWPWPRSPPTSSRWAPPPDPSEHVVPSEYGMRAWPASRTRMRRTVSRTSGGPGR